MPDQLTREQKLERAQNIIARRRLSGKPFSPEMERIIAEAEAKGTISIPKPKKGEAPLPNDPTLRKRVVNPGVRPKSYPAFTTPDMTGSFSENTIPYQQSEKTKGMGNARYASDVIFGLMNPIGWGNTALNMAKGVVGLGVAAGTDIIETPKRVKDIYNLKKSGAPTSKVVEEALRPGHTAETIGGMFGATSKDGVTTKALSAYMLNRQANDTSLPANARAAAKAQADRLTWEIKQGILDMTHDEPTQQVVNVALAGGAIGKAGVGARAANAARNLSSLEKAAAVADDAGKAALTPKIEAARAQLIQLKLREAGIASAEHGVATLGIPKAIGKVDSVLSKNPGYAGAKAKAAAAIKKPLAAGKLNKAQGQIANAQMLQDFQDLTDEPWRKGQEQRDITDTLQRQVQEFARSVRYKKGDPPVTEAANPPAPPATPPALVPEVAPPTLPTPETLPVGGRAGIKESLGEADPRVTITQGIPDEQGNIAKPITTVQGGEGGWTPQRDAEFRAGLANMNDGALNKILKDSIDENGNVWDQTTHSAVMDELARRKPIPIPDNLGSLGPSEIMSLWAEHTRGKKEVPPVLKDELKRRNMWQDAPVSDPVSTPAEAPVEPALPSVPPVAEAKPLPPVETPVPEPYAPDTTSPYYMGGEPQAAVEPTPAVPVQEVPTPRFTPDIFRGFAARILHDNPPGGSSIKMPNMEAVTLPEITDAINEAGQGIIKRLGLTREEGFALETELDNLAADALLKHKPGSPLTPERFRQALLKVTPEAGVGPEPWKEYEGGLTGAIESGQEATRGGAGEGNASPITDGYNAAPDRVPGEQGLDGEGKAGTNTSRIAGALGAGGTGLSAIIPGMDLTSAASLGLMAGVGVAGVALLRGVAKYGGEGLGKLKSKLETDSSAAKRVDTLLSQYVEAVLPGEAEAAAAHALAIDQYQKDLKQYQKKVAAIKGDRDAWRQRKADWLAANPKKPFKEPFPKPEGTRPKKPSPPDPPTADEIAQARADIVRMVQQELEMRPQKGVPPEQAAQIADEFIKTGDKIASVFEDLGQELVDSGLISEEAYTANKGRYLRRIYQMWEDPEGYMSQLEAKLKAEGVPKEQIGASLSRERQIFEAATGRSADNVQMTGSGPSGRTSKAKLSRRKLTDSAKDAETRDFLGEVGLASIRIRRGGEISARELSKAKLSKSVADNFAITSKRVKELDELRDAYEEAKSQPSDSDFATPVERTYYYHPEIFDQVERNDNLKGLGHLEGDTFYGSYIPASIRKELTAGEYKPTSAIQKYLMAWKVSKTAFNPSSWAGNVLGNVQLAYLGGGMRALNPENFARATQSLRTRDAMAKEKGTTPYFELALKYSDHPYESLRMEITTREHLDPSIVYPDNMKNALVQAGRKSKDAVTNLYGGIDTVFKHGLFMDTMDRLAEIDPSMKVEARAQIAAQQVAKTFPNFRHGTPIRLLRPAVKTLRRGASPFISWDASVIPLAARLIMEHPARAALFPAMYQAYQKSIESWMASQPGGKEQYDEEKRVLPDYMRGYVRLPVPNDKSPTTGEEGQSAYYMDSKALNPLTGITDFGDESVNPLDAMLQRLNPIFSTLEQIRENRKVGTDIPISQEGDPADARARAVAGFAAQQLAPYATQAMQLRANLTGQFERPRMRDNGKGETVPTYQMDKGERLRQAARLARVNVKQVDIPKEGRNRAYGLRDAQKAQRTSGRAAQRDVEATKGRPLTEDEAQKAASPSVKVLQDKVRKVRGGG